MPEQILQKTPSLVVAELNEKAFYLVLKQYDEHKESDSHELIKNRTEELEFKYLRREYPDYNESEHSEEYIERAALLHYPVEIEEE